MWNKQHRQYNVDRLELVDVLYEQLNSQVSKEILTVIICDFEALILQELTKHGPIDRQWIIPNIVYLYNKKARRSKRIDNKQIVNLFLEQKLFDFL